MSPMGRTPHYQYICPVVKADKAFDTRPHCVLYVRIHFVVLPLNCGVFQVLSVFKRDPETYQPCFPIPAQLLMLYYVLLYQDCYLTNLKALCKPDTMTSCFT